MLQTRSQAPQSWRHSTTTPSARCYHKLSRMVLELWFKTQNSDLESVRPAALFVARESSSFQSKDSQGAFAQGLAENRPRMLMRAQGPECEGGVRGRGTHGGRPQHPALVERMRTGVIWDIRFIHLRQNAQGRHQNQVSLFYVFFLCSYISLSR